MKDPGFAGAIGLHPSPASGSEYAMQGRASERGAGKKRRGNSTREGFFCVDDDGSQILILMYGPLLGTMVEAVEIRRCLCSLHISMYDVA